jgi:hypothetical protein
MNSRKLMGALSILLLAILVMTIGCGDGKNNKRENFRKGTGGNAAVGNPKDIKNKSQKMTSIDGSMTSYTDEGGQAVAQQSLEAGKYELSEVMGYARYDREQDAVRAISIAAITNGSLGAGSAEQIGMMGKDSDSPRTVEVPLSFEINGQSLKPSTQVLYSIQLGGQVGLESKIVHSLTTGGRSEINILKAISGQPDGSNMYGLKLAGNKTGEVHIRKVSGGIRITVTTFEMKQDEVVKNPKAVKNSNMIKRMAFTYRLTKANQQAAAAPQQQAAVQPAPAASQPQPPELEAAQEPGNTNVGAP